MGMCAELLIFPVKETIYFFWAVRLMTLSMRCLYPSEESQSSYSSHLWTHTIVSCLEQPRFFLWYKLQDTSNQNLRTFWLRGYIQAIISSSHGYLPWICVHAFLIYTFGLCNIFWNELHVVIYAALSVRFEPAAGELNVALFSFCIVQNIK